MTDKSQISKEEFFNDILEALQKRQSIQTIKNKIVNSFNLLENTKQNIIVSQMLYFYELERKYFENINITDIYTNKYRQKELFPQIFFSTDVGKLFIMEINNLEIFKIRQTSVQWKECKNDCSSVLKKYIDMEISSTAYMLRLIIKSLVKTSSKNHESVFLTYHNEDNTPLTGKWKNDKKYFMLQNSYNGEPRLIMGFGPSASGKTYWTKTIVSLLKEKISDFPQVFLSIDGGIAREISLVYQMILNQIKLSNFKGLKNLVNASAFSFLPNLFPSDKIKKSLTKFIEKNNIANNGPNMSLYVPITLGGCISNCESKYKKYIDLTNDDSWIGLLIYQHKLQEECHFQSGYRCKSTTISGSTRQVSQGKKFSSNAFNNSMKNGYTELSKSPFLSLEIHNSGGLDKNKSIIMEYPQSSNQNNYFILDDENSSIVKDDYIIIPKNKESDYTQDDTD